MPVNKKGKAIKEAFYRFVLSLLPTNSFVLQVRNGIKCGSQLQVQIINIWTKELSNYSYNEVIRSKNHVNQVLKISKFFYSNKKILCFFLASFRTYILILNL